jgi:hypothetical protein
LELDRFVPQARAANHIPDPAWRPFGGARQGLDKKSENNPMQSRVDPARSARVALRRGTKISSSNQKDPSDLQRADDAGVKEYLAFMSNLPNAALRELSLLLPGITATTGPDDYLQFRQLRRRRFNGKSWVGFGEIRDDRQTLRKRP